jgi:hypothetical protein
MRASTNGKAQTWPPTTPSAWVGLLTPFSNPGTARYHVIEHRRRDDFVLSRPDGADARLWWQLSE